MLERVLLDEVIRRRLSVPRLLIKYLIGILIDQCCSCRAFLVDAVSKAFLLDSVSELQHDKRSADLECLPLPPFYWEGFLEEDEGDIFGMIVLYDDTIHRELDCGMGGITKISLIFTSESFPYQCSI